ncbi:MAG: biotin--[acetyl-CoA-carboxylase] ligase [Candidatus Enterosoma sp.]|nr:biotin--[acetyl-CoA-carboxylase] ligase [Bacilli bacterium]MDD7328680.1 biotin--[acetyl-CoA-carboxylase] ligase [bacterium]MDY2896400.1 biotin--[acetyl-CoA-carboxylase] ligase [Candidatus Enterosoma sp.]MDD7707830.1 biotin--[acetyl-CoA-carboxylase] ligase [bacterium]MDY3210811.1 biotin--[acetyl-CoA-carboxylase] ligase [Candidatus Enterosoma sp.]
MSILTFDTLDSTNSYLKRNGKNLDHFTVVQANHQEQGKGRLGRSWQDQGNSLLFSILLKEKIEPERVPLLSLLAGASVVLTLEHYGLTPLVKWPNDTLVSEKKISGILTEAVSEGEDIFYIVGIGINLNQKEFEGELSQKATSLFLLTKKEYDKEEVLTVLLSYFTPLYQDYIQGGKKFLTVVKSHSYLDQKEVSLDYYGEHIHGTVIDITDKGTLLLDVSGKQIEVSSGEVTLNQMYLK